MIEFLLFFHYNNYVLRIDKTKNQNRGCETTMKDRSVEFKENFPDYLCVKHKIAEHTEKQTFHLHSQLEIIFTISDNLVCFYENAVIRIPNF